MKVTINSINHIYRYATYRANERCGETVTVQGMMGGTHTFCRARLEEKYMYVLSAIKGLPTSMRYSISSIGAPWIQARGEGSRYKGALLESTERLLAMAVALGMARILRPDCPCCDVVNVVIDDERIRKMEMMQPKSCRRSSLIRW